MLSAKHSVVHDYQPSALINLDRLTTMHEYCHSTEPLRGEESLWVLRNPPVRSHRISGSVIGRQSRSKTAVWVANSSVDAADSYFASTACSDNTLPRYNVNTFLNSATTRTFPLESASP